MKKFLRFLIPFLLGIIVSLFLVNYLDIGQDVKGLQAELDEVRGDLDDCRKTQKALTKDDLEGVTYYVPDEEGVSYSEDFDPKEAQAVIESGSVAFSSDGSKAVSVVSFASGNIYYKYLILVSYRSGEVSQLDSRYLGKDVEVSDVVFIEDEVQYLVNGKSQKISIKDNQFSE